MRIFIDSNFFIARLVPQDQWRHSAVQASFKEFEAVTCSPVVNETITLLQRRGWFSTALGFLSDVREGLEVRVVYPDAGLQVEAWDLFARWGGSGANPVDCMSFAIMRREGIRKAYTFGEHFRTAGFEILRPKR